MADLEARVRRLEDRAEILNLIARYYNAVDDRDIDLVADLFCEDGAYGRYNGTDRADGRDEIFTFYTERLKNAGPTFHYPHAHLIEFESDTRATGVVTAHAEMGVGDELILAGFRYHDRYRKDPDGVWRFEERLTKFFYFMTVEDLARHYSAPERLRWPRDPAPADLPNQLDTWKAFRAGS